MNSIYSIEEDIDFSDDNDDELFFNTFVNNGKETNKKDNESNTNTDKNDNQVQSTTDNEKIKDSNDQALSKVNKREINQEVTELFDFSDDEFFNDCNNDNKIETSTSECFVSPNKRKFNFHRKKDDKKLDEDHYNQPTKRQYVAEKSANSFINYDDINLIPHNDMSKCNMKIGLQIDQSSSASAISKNICTTGQSSSIKRFSKSGLQNTDVVVNKALSPQNNASNTIATQSKTGLQSKDSIEFAVSKNIKMMLQNHASKSNNKNELSNKTPDIEKNILEVLDNNIQKTLLNNSNNDDKNKKGISKRLSIERKFPGPAGALPTPDKFKKLKSPKAFDIKSLKLSPGFKESLPNLNPLSQDEDFSTEQWDKLKKHIEEISLEISFQSIATVLKSSSSKQLENGKVSGLYGLIKFVSFYSTTGHIVLKDPTGEIIGTVHKKVVEEYEKLLKQGTGLILKNISVYSPTPKKHYLNITPANIVLVLSISESS